MLDVKFKNNQKLDEIMQTTQQEREMNGDEISIADIFIFLKQNTKNILIGSLIGSLFGLIVFYQTGRYTATATLTNDGSIDFVLLKSLQNELPKIAEANNHENKYGYLNKISSDEWWKKNLKTTYAITKADVKDFELSAKDNRILNLSFSINGNSEDVIKDELTSIVDFFKNNSMLIIAKELFQKYKIEIETRDSELAKNEQASLIEINYMKVKTRNLEEVKGRFQQNSSVINSQFLDPKESGSKYLPINTQLIAMYADIAAQHEAIERIKDERAILELKKKVFDEFEKSLSVSADGPIALNNIRKNINQDINNFSGKSQEDMRRIMALKKIEAEIASIQTKFSVGLSERTPIQVSRNSFAKFLVIGSVVGLFCGLIYAFANQMLKRFMTE